MSAGISKALVLLRYLAQMNDYVQNYLYENMDTFLKVQTCGSELALVLREVGSLCVIIALKRDCFKRYFPLFC